MNAKKIYLTLIASFIICNISLGQQHTLTSPNGKLKVNISISKNITFEAFLNESTVILPTKLSLHIGERKLGYSPNLISKKVNEIRKVLTPVIPRKAKEMENHYNQTTLKFKDGYRIVFRIYDEGVAYRFETSFKDQIEVNNEELVVDFPQGGSVFFPEEKSFISHYEQLFDHRSLESIPENSLASLPLLFQSKEKVNVLITEANLFDYPNLFLEAEGGNSMKANFPKEVLEAVPAEKRPDRQEKINKKASYIAKTEGTRNFPWRVFIISDQDEKLIENDLIYKLSRPSVLNKTDWIKPGKVAWDWYNANNIYDVDFKAGLNTKTYKYYIDFAASNNLDYVILDEGWSKSTTDLTKANPNLDLSTVIEYGEEKDIGIILWMLWKPLYQNMEALLDQFSAWGVKGIKVDFMQRADVDMVNFYEKLAKESAARKLLVNLHSSFKPTGLHRTYPNLLTFEGVKGLENNKWSKNITPEHNLTLPFTRMVAGPMDYTPGAMVNANKDNFAPLYDTPMSMGTRSHQVAMYIVYESPMQMLADSPTNYYKEAESTEFISKIPTTWDETEVLDAKISDYVLLARKKNDKWYVGAMTDWTSRELELDFSFLNDGSYEIKIFQDGVNADRNANDYKLYTKRITNNSKITIKLAPGGGWTGIIKKI